MGQSTCRKCDGIGQQWKGGKWVNCPQCLGSGSYALGPAALPGRAEWLRGNRLLRCVIVCCRGGMDCPTGR